MGVSSFTEEYGYFTADAFMLTAEASIDLVGGSAGAYLCGMGISRDITIFGKKINVGIELNCGAGVDFSIGPETEIGVCVGVGPSIKIDWEP